MREYGLNLQQLNSAEFDENIIILLDQKIWVRLPLIC